MKVIVNQMSFIDNILRQPGEVIDYEGDLSSNLSPEAAPAPVADPAPTDPAAPTA